jgi:multicomponent Na+:H+ antiporter subunit C
MPQWLLYAMSGAALFAVGVSGLFIHADVMRKILAANISASGVFLVLVAIARRSTMGVPDPVPHALVLTGIVVSVSATALALALIRRLGEAEEVARKELDERER